ncbi:MAG: type II toxin-antitoxin system VapC family toxin [Candidatus Levyibacteriota bacterium]
MKRVVIDTDVLIDFSKGHSTWLEKSLRQEKRTIELILPTVVIAEYLASHILEDPKLMKATEELFSLFRKQDFTEEIAKILALILRKKNYPRSAGFADLVIASTTVYLDAQLATRNKVDFSDIPKLRLFDTRDIL